MALQHLLMQILDGSRRIDLRRARIQQPRLCQMGLGYLHHRWLLFEVDLHRVTVARCKGVALDLVVQRRRRAGDREQVLALLAQLRQRGKQRPGLLKIVQRLLLNNIENILENIICKVFIKP